MGNTICYFIPDTNIFLHYQTFTEINWLKELGVKEAILLICLSVMRELDHRKFNASDDRIKERARKVLAKLDNVSENNQNFRENVRLELIPREPNIDWASEGLNCDVKDDWIIATILCERENYPNLVLVTADTGLKMKAKFRGIETKKLPDKLLLKSGKDPRQQEIENLRKQLLELQNRMPELYLLLLSNDQYGKVADFRIIQPAKLSPEEIEKRLAEIQQKLTYVPPKKNPYPLMPFYGPPSKEEIQRFKDDVEKYLERLRDFLEEKHNYDDLMSRTIELQFLLLNAGNAPADDIDVFLYFPDGFEMCEEKELPEKPREPAKPIPPRGQTELLVSTFEKFRTPMSEGLKLLSSRPPNTPPSSDGKPFIKKTNSYEVRYHLEQLKHGMERQFDPVYITFPSFEDAKSFHVDVLIVPANHPKIQDRIHVKIEKGLEYP